MKEIDDEEEIKDLHDSLKLIDEKKDLTKLLSANFNDLRLSCPECDLIPAIFNDIKSKNIYQISSACENKHLISCIPVKSYYHHFMNLKNSSKENLKDFICIKHNENYNSFCKTCQKNICKQCSDSEHRNHFLSQFYELLPTNEEIIQLKNSIENELNDINVLFKEIFQKWINELQQKFNEFINIIICKNKLYEYIINFYETKEFNYQNIYNIKIISQNQLKKNPLTQEIQVLKDIVLKNKQNNKNINNNITDNELNDKFFKLKSTQILKILDIINIDCNSNYKFKRFESSTSNLENNLNDKKKVSTIDDFEILDKVSDLESDNNSNNKNEESKNIVNEKMEFANEVKLSKRKLTQNIEVGSIVNALTVLKDYNGRTLNKFAAGLDNGIINVYYVDPKNNNIYLDYEIKEHTKGVIYLTCLHDGRILSCGQDGVMKLTEETYSYILSFWRRYYLIQTLTRPSSDKYDQFQPVSVIEMNNNTLVSGDWKHIIIWKLKKNEKKKKKKEYVFDINDYNKDRYSYIYEIFKEINITTSVTALLKIDENNFISAHYGPSIVTFYNISDNTSYSINKIRCVDSATQCMTLIETKKPESKWQKDKIVIIGGYNCVYLLSAKQQNLIDKITIPGNNYIKCLFNSGIDHISNGYICGGLFNQYDYDLIHYNTKTQIGFSEIVVNETSRIKETDKGPINSVIFLKKNVNDKSYDQKNIVVITGGNEQNIKTYYVKEEKEEKEE